MASSDKAYGDWSGRPYREDMALRARHPYDVSKAAGDLIAQSYAATYHLPVAITRCGNLYGGGDLNWSRVVPGTIRSALEGERPVIRSDGTYVRDYLHVSDAAAGVLDLSEAVRSRPDVQGQAFNFASGIRPTVIDVVQRILALMELPLEPVVLAKERNTRTTSFLGPCEAVAWVASQGHARRGATGGHRLVRAQPAAPDMSPGSCRGCGPERP